MMKAEIAGIEKSPTHPLALMLVLGIVVVSRAASAEPGLRLSQLGAAPIKAALPDGARIDGALLRDPGGEIDVMYGGARFHIPDPNTFTSMHFDARRVLQLGAGQLAQIGTIPMNGTLLRDRQTGEIDVVVDGKRYHIPDMDTFNRQGFAGKPVHELWAGGLNQIPEGPWPAPQAGHVAIEKKVVRDVGDLPPPRIINSSGEISGPVCPDGGHVEVTVQLVPSPGAVTVQAHVKGTNHCVTDNLGPTVTIALMDDAGNRVTDQLEVDVPEVPARGFSRPTVREADKAMRISTSLDLGTVKVSYRNRFHGNWFISMITSPVFWEIVGEVVSFIAAA